LKYHKPVEPYFNKTVDWVHHQMNRLPMHFNRETADKIVTTTVLMQGGNLMVAPIALAEHHKVPIVEGLNTALGDKTPPETIEHAPQQTLGSLVKGRLLGWLAAFSVIKGAMKLYPTTLESFENETGNLLCKLMKKPTERLVGAEMHSTKTFMFGKIGALDFFATVASASLLYIGGHFFARKQQEKKAHQAHNAPEHRITTVPEKMTEGMDTPTLAATPTAIATHEISGTKLHQGTLHQPEIGQALNAIN
jgi:hypothetical protein